MLAQLALPLCHLANIIAQCMIVMRIFLRSNCYVGIYLTCRDANKMLAMYHVAYTVDPLLEYNWEWT